MSIKALAINVLQRNSQRNRSETPSFTGVKFESEKISCAKLDETAMETAVKEALPMPHFGPDGDIVIPFGSDPRYHWWNGGQSTAETIKELKSWKH